MAVISSGLCSLSIDVEKDTHVHTSKKRSCTDGQDLLEYADLPTEFSSKKRKKKQQNETSSFYGISKPFPLNFWSSATTDAVSGELDRIILKSDKRVITLPSCENISFLPGLFEAVAVEQCPAISLDPYLCRKMELIEADLNAVKALVGTMEPSSWNSLTNYSDLASSLRYMVKTNCDIELGTNAWLKFWSILHAYPTLASFSDQSTDTTSVHLCEAPGAFVSALNHYLAVNCPERHTAWNWMASSLNPYLPSLNDEAVVDDRLIKFTSENWHFGADGTGNLKCTANQNAIVDEMRSAGKKVLLVTADGGVDCSDDPAMQEATLSSLKYAEVITALRLLAPGGHLVLKIFTTFRIKTAIMLKVLCSLFTQVNLHKPSTSKPGNSEVYVVCIKLRQSSEDSVRFLEGVQSISLNSDLERLKKICQQDSDFSSRIVEAARFFADSQSATIERNLSLYSANRNRRIRTCFHEAKRSFCTNFIERYPFGTLPSVARLMSPATTSETPL